MLFQPLTLNLMKSKGAWGDQKDFDLAKTELDSAKKELEAVRLELETAKQTSELVSATDLSGPLQKPDETIEAELNSVKNSWRLKKLN